MRLRTKRSLRFTREGKWFVVLTLGIGFGAINTGNNLLHLVLGMMLAFIIGSSVLSEISLRGLKVTRRIPDRLFAERPFLMGIHLHNEKRRFPSFSIEIEDQLVGHQLDRKCYFLKIPSLRTQRTSYRHSFARRGLYRLSGFSISTKYPFGLFRKSAAVEYPDDVVVFPQVYPVLPPGGIASERGDRVRGKLQRRGDYYALRDYVTGDDPRDIYWRKSARTGKLVIRQHEDRQGDRIAIFLDNHQRVEVLAPEDIDRQEQAVSHAASLAAHYIKRGYVVRLVTRTISVGPNSGEAHLTQILTALALVDFVREEVPYNGPSHWTGECIFVTPGGAFSAPKLARVA